MKKHACGVCDFQSDAISLIYSSVLDLPEEIQHDSSSITYQGNYSTLYDYAKDSKSALHTALKAQIFISKPVQDISKLWLKSSAINSADRNVNAVIAEGEEPFLSPFFWPLMLCNADLDSAVLFLREVSS